MMYPDPQTPDEWQHVEHAFHFCRNIAWAGSAVIGAGDLVLYTLVHACHMEALQGLSDEGWTFAIGSATLFLLGLVAQYGVYAAKLGNPRNRKE